MKNDLKNIVALIAKHARSIPRVCKIIGIK